MEYLNKPLFPLTLHGVGLRDALEQFVKIQIFQHKDIVHRTGSDEHDLDFAYVT